MAAEKILRDFVKRGQAAQRAVDHELTLHDLRGAIQQLQDAIQETAEEDTRRKMREALRAIQRIANRLESEKES
jgi:hypothetical protein